MRDRLTRWLRRPDPTFDPAWEALLGREYPYWSLLTEAERARMRLLIARNVEAFDWEAARGMEIDDRVRVLVTAQAVLLLLGIDLDGFDDVSSVIVHRSTVRLRGTHRSAAGTVTEETQHLAGQAHPKGPVVLSWAAVTRDMARPDSGRNVVYHEFAHRLDMLDGLTDGTPPLETDERAARWADVCAAAFARSTSGESVMRSYAATNPAEFFAVATEVFFEQPWKLVESERELYDELTTFFGQDPWRRLTEHHERQID